MSFSNSINVSASGLTEQRLRMDIKSQNIANADTTVTMDGKPYKRKAVLFKEQGNTMFNRELNKAINNNFIGKGVEVAKITEDNRPGSKVYEPNSPYSDENGYIEKSNVNIVEEMVNMISASRSYEANVTAINTAKSMISKTLEMGKF